MEENEIVPSYLTWYRKINFRRIKDLNVKQKPVKPSEDKVARYLYDLMVERYRNANSIKKKVLFKYIKSLCSKDTTSPWSSNWFQLGTGIVLSL